MALPESARFSEAGFRDEEANKKPFTALQSILSCLMVEAEKNLLFILHLNGWLAWTTGSRSMRCLTIICEMGGDGTRSISPTWLTL